MSGNQPPSALRYLVQPIPYGVTDSERRASWSVVDTRPECEHYTTQAGVELLEERPPVWRQVAYCLKQGHAEMIRDALNKEANPLLRLNDDGTWIRVSEALRTDDEAAP